MRKSDSYPEPKFPIWPVLEHYGWDLPSPKHGWTMVKCEKHGEKHSSAAVNEEQGYVFCHACEFKGDAIDVVMIYEGVGFKDAVRKCEEITGGVAILSQEGRGATRDKRGARSYKPPRLRR